jgi:hypothetical protein
MESFVPYYFMVELKNMYVESLESFNPGRLQSWKASILEGFNPGRLEA